MFTVRRHSYPVKKRGENVSYQGRKSARTVNNLILCDNSYNILAISDGIDGNHHDSYKIVENTHTMIQSLDKHRIDYHRSHLNADSAFDAQAFMAFIQQQGMIANIRQNKRNTKKKDKQYRYMSEYIDELS